MKPRRLILSCVALMSGCVSPPVTLPARLVVREGEHPPGGLYWGPAEAEIAALENDLGKLWVRPDGRMIGRTKMKLSDYVVRYYGIEADGQRFIVGEGQHTSLGNAGPFLGEVRDLVVLRAFDGGDLGFEVRYDVAAKRVIEVRFGAAL